VDFAHKRAVRKPASSARDVSPESVYADSAISARSPHGTTTLWRIMDDSRGRPTRLHAIPDSERPTGTSRRRQASHEAATQRGQASSKGAPVRRPGIASAGSVRERVMLLEKQVRAVETEGESTW